jgi:hypothetical protein
MDNLVVEELTTASYNLLHQISVESAKKFVETISSPLRLIRFLKDFPPDIVSQTLRLCEKQLPDGLRSVLADTLASVFLPRFQTEFDAIADLFLVVCSNDCFTHHYVLSKLVEKAPPEELPKILFSFIENEDKITPTLSQFYCKQITVLAPTGDIHLIKFVMKLFQFDHQAGVSLLPLFQQTDDPVRNVYLCDLYAKAPEDNLDSIRKLLQSPMTNVSAYLLGSLRMNSDHPMIQIVSLILESNNLIDLMGNDHELMIENEMTPVPMLASEFDQLSCTQAIATLVSQNQLPGFRSSPPCMIICTSPLLTRPSVHMHRIAALFSSKSF